MKRKMVSFILCIAMCMALAIPAFAVELSPYATDEVGNFSQMIEFAFSDNVEGRFRYSYNDAAGNVVDGKIKKDAQTFFKSVRPSQYAAMRQRFFFYGSGDPNV